MCLNKSAQPRGHDALGHCYIGTHKWTADPITITPDLKMRAGGWGPGGGGECLADADRIRQHGWPHGCARLGELCASDSIGCNVAPEPYSVFSMVKFLFAPISRSQMRLLGGHGMFAIARDTKNPPVSALHILVVRVPSPGGERASVGQLRFSPEGSGLVSPPLSPPPSHFPVLWCGGYLVQPEW